MGENRLRAPVVREEFPAIIAGEQCLLHLIFRLSPKKSFSPDRKDGGRGFGREDDVVISVIDMQDAFEIIDRTLQVCRDTHCVRVFFNLGNKRSEIDKVYMLFLYTDIDRTFGVKIFQVIVR